MRFLRRGSEGRRHHLLRDDFRQWANMYGRAKYLAIERPDRIVYTQQFCDENEQVIRAPFFKDWPETMLTTVELTAEAPDRTRVTCAGSRTAPRTRTLQNSCGSAAA